MMTYEEFKNLFNENAFLNSEVCGELHPEAQMLPLWDPHLPAQTLKSPSEFLNELFSWALFCLYDLFYSVLILCNWLHSFRRDQVYNKFFYFHLGWHHKELFKFVFINEILFIWTNFNDENDSKKTSSR